MTIISSGGFLPSNNLSNILINNSQIIITSFLMLTSFFSIFLFYNLVFTKNHNLNEFSNSILLNVNRKVKNSKEIINTIIDKKYLFYIQF